ncbi:MAG: ABC transporter ATP-binding protein [Actinobacteria bacterium]|nr:ABC transporter ATP-binding protein [Actinomycetota bacterium]
MATRTDELELERMLDHGGQHLLEVNDIHVEFRTRDGIVNAVNGLSYTLDEGESIAILGESGSGKSVSAQAVMGIIDTPPGYVTQGEVKLRGVDLLQVPERQMRKVRGERIAMIFQDALTALNPVFTVGFQIAEMFRIHRGMSRSEARKEAAVLMDRVRIPNAEQRLADFPHQFSGGMRQRVMIAMALALDPDVLIADEPTTALDVTVQAQIMQLLADLQDETGMGLVLITHDLGVVAEVAEQVVVMYAGRAMEKGPIHDVYHEPAHPYTLGLMNSIPRADQKGQRLDPIRGQPPNLADIPAGCEFHPRCPFMRPVCKEKTPPLMEVDADRLSACHFIDEVLEVDHWREARE